MCLTGVENCRETGNGKRETNKREPGTGNREPKLLTESPFPVPGGCASGAPPPGSLYSRFPIPDSLLGSGLASRPCSRRQYARSTSIDISSV